MSNDASGRDTKRRSLLKAMGAVAAQGCLLGAAKPAVSNAKEQESTVATTGKVDALENVWVAARDGTRLAYRLWVPSSARTTPVGVVLEAIPYSKRDGTRAADNAWAEQFCPKGFAYARLDLRGTGESSGLLRDEYLAQEQEDIVDVIDHLSRQPWCNGAVGMRGYSWGGFNSLQVAALRPPALKAIITACSTDDRYLTDAHYVGGVPAFVNLLWGALFKNVLVDAPDPKIVGGRWRQMWIERLRNSPAVVSEWLSHPTYDEYWRHGSVSKDYGAIRCGVYAVGGQTDAYTSTVLRLLSNLSAPRKGLIGPWAHQFPDGATPGPGLDWLAEEVRWWRYWLYGEDNGVMREPMLRVYVNERTAGEVWPRDVPGRWISEAVWPSPHISNAAWYLNDAGLEAGAQPRREKVLPPHQTMGMAKRDWLPLNMAGDLPRDQAQDEAKGLVFDSQPLETDVTVVGNGSAVLRVAADRHVAKAVVRLSELDAEGRSWSITYGALNLTHREGHDRPSHLEPGRAYDVTVPLGFAAHKFKRGSRIRLTVSESMWPLLAPSPQPVALTVTTGASFLKLPVRTSAAALEGAVVSTQAPDARNATAESPERLTISGPVHDGRVTITKVWPAGSWVLEDIATERIAQSRQQMSIKDGDPSSCVWRVEMSAGSRRPDWNFRTACAVELRMTPKAFHVEETVQAFEKNKRVFSQTLRRRIPRQYS